MLLVMAEVDWKRRVIPDGLLLAAVFNRCVWAVAQNEISLRTLFTMAASAATALCLLVLVLALEELKGRGVMGGGDVKLLFVMALYLDWYHLLLALLAACVSGLFAALIFRKKGGDVIPFGPFLAIGYILQVGYILVKSSFLSSWFLL